MEVDKSLFTLHGPFSDVNANIEEHPGPPVNHSTVGDVDGFNLDSNIQKK